VTECPIAADSESRPTQPSPFPFSFPTLTLSLTVHLSLSLELTCRAVQHQHSLTGLLGQHVVDALAAVGQLLHKGVGSVQAASCVFSQVGNVKKQKERRVCVGGRYMSVLACMHCKHVSKHHVTHQARDNKKTGISFFRKFPEMDNIHTETTSFKRKPVFGFPTERMHDVCVDREWCVCK